jgi:hypothetical protein
MVNKTRHLQMFACANAVQGFLARLKRLPPADIGSVLPCGIRLAKPSDSVIRDGVTM